jgi:hypothetical protein
MLLIATNAEEVFLNKVIQHIELKCFNSGFDEFPDFMKFK